MAETQEKQSRSDLYIKHDIDHLETSYPPLVNDRHQVEITINEGVITVSGYVKSYPTVEYILSQFPKVEGVTSVNSDDLYVDESIRREAGKVIAPGVSINVEYGSVIISGLLTEGFDSELLVKQVSSVEGVRRIVTSFV